MVYYKNISRLDIRIGNKVFKHGEITSSDRYIVHKGLVRVDVTEHKIASDKSKEPAKAVVKGPISKNNIPGVKPKIRKVRAKKAEAEAEENVVTSILEDTEADTVADSESKSEE